MRAKLQVISHLAIILILLLAVSLVTACIPGEAETGAPATIKTWLLVRAPEVPLPTGRQINVKSRSEAPQPGVSHVELHLVEYRSPDNNELLLSNVLIRSDAAPAPEQTVFTAEQRFTPNAPGHYVLKVVGYDKTGRPAESEYIGFTVQ
jgi:hypothetical protein